MSDHVTGIEAEHPASKAARPELLRGSRLVAVVALAAIAGAGSGAVAMHELDRPSIRPIFGRRVSGPTPCSGNVVNGNLASTYGLHTCWEFQHDARATIVYAAGIDPQTGSGVLYVRDGGEKFVSIGHAYVDIPQASSRFACYVDHDGETEGAYDRRRGKLVKTAPPCRFR